MYESLSINKVNDYYHLICIVDLPIVIWQDFYIAVSLLLLVLHMMIGLTKC